MVLSRRMLLSSTALLVLPTVARAQALPPETALQSERSVGSPTAKAVVDEWFSLTCTHCARFAQETFPEVKKNLIDTGKVRWVFRDFPLDRVALMAAMVARALPPERYEPFILALFAGQDRWAFAQGVDSKEEVWKIAALAGMSRATFDAAVGDTALQNWILATQKEAETKYAIDATPSFVINGKKMSSGEMGYDAFVKLLPGVV
ncbi:MAG: thioredoxin domain-containing protein [Acetobacteraceae bacterium]